MPKWSRRGAAGSFSPAARRLGCLAACVVLAAACSRPAAPVEPAIRLTTPEHGAPAYVEVVGLPEDVLDALEDAQLTADEWAAILRVSVGPDAPPMLGAHAVRDAALTFTPAFPIDPGRSYEVRFDPSRIPDSAARTMQPLASTVGLPAADASPSTTVTRIYPTGDVVPENLLRMYVEFSAPMGRKSGIEHMTLLNGAGKEIPGAILPLDYEFWSPDHKRFTVFFDPGRVKDGILPNREMGRPLERDTAMTLVVSREWRDAYGRPLKQEYRRTFRVAPADTTPIDPSAWTIAPPPARSRTPVTVTFPEPLDHGLLMRAIGVTRDGAPLDGDIVVATGERQWTFTPKDPWQGGRHELLALDILEDLAGNQIGRAFEVDNFDTVDKSPDPQTIRLPFMVRH